MFKKLFFIACIDLLLVGVNSNLVLAQENNSSYNKDNPVETCGHIQRKNEKRWIWTGFPYALFSWDNIPWGISQKQFKELYLTRLQQCGVEVAVSDNFISVFSKTEDNEIKKEEALFTVTDFVFDTNQNDSKLVSVQINGGPLESLNEQLFNRYGKPEGLWFTDELDGSRHIERGVWFLPKTTIFIDTKLAYHASIESAERSEKKFKSLSLWDGAKTKQDLDHTCGKLQNKNYVDGTWKGFPYALFDWDNIPWGISQDEFEKLYLEKLQHCGPHVSVSEGNIRVHHDKYWYGNIQFVFSGEGKNSKLVRIQMWLGPVYDVAVQLFKRYGKPNIGYPSTLEELEKTHSTSGIWLLPKTTIVVDLQTSIITIDSSDGSWKEPRPKAVKECKPDEALNPFLW